MDLVCHTIQEAKPNFFVSVLPLQVFLQVWPPGPAHEEAPLREKRDESCRLKEASRLRGGHGRRDACTSQSMPFCFLPSYLQGPLFGRSFEGYKSHVRIGIAPTVHGVWVTLDSPRHWFLTFWEAPEPFAVSMRTENVNGWDDCMLRIYYWLYGEADFFFPPCGSKWLQETEKKKQFECFVCEEYTKGWVDHQSFPEGCLHLIKKNI